MHLRPLFNLLLAQMVMNTTSMTNVIVLCKADNHSRALVQRLIKYIKNSWISSIPLAKNKPEGRSSVRLNSLDCTEAGGHGKSNATACSLLETSPSRRSLALQMSGSQKASQPHPEPHCTAKHQVAKCLGDSKCCFLSPVCRLSGWGGWKLGLGTGC